MPDPLDLELEEVHELLCGCWELNSGLLEEQPVLLTMESSLQSPANALCMLVIQ